MQIAGSSYWKGRKCSSNSHSDSEDTSRSEEREETEQQRKFHKVSRKRAVEFAHQNSKCRKHCSAMREHRRHRCSEFAFREGKTVSLFVFGTLLLCQSVHIGPEKQKYVGFAFWFDQNSQHRSFEQKWKRGKWEPSKNYWREQQTFHKRRRWE